MLALGDTTMRFRRFALAFGLTTLLGAWYIDPGSSSLVWQLILSAVLGTAFTARRFFASLAAKLFRRPKSGIDDRDAATRL